VADPDRSALHDITAKIAVIARGSGLTVAAAESITAGEVATALAAASDASEWFGASIVAYETAMKRKVLGVRSERIISEQCAREMAEGVLLLTGADLVVATTGVGGPDPEEGKPPGTVVICAGTRDDLRVFEHALPGSPEEVVKLATRRALEHLRDAALASVGGVR
jgi:nicotinamide-nucleotide amidase